MLSIGIVGMGGYAGHVCDGVMKDIGRLSGVRLVAACDPRPHDHPQRLQRLQQHGATVMSRFEDLLAADVDAVWLPLPIGLHRSFTEKALSAGKAVLVEKPAAGTVDDVDAMIAARDRAGRPVAVGFQNLFDPNAWLTKRHVLGGGIGAVRSASVIGCWPRPEAYYARAAWAGRASHDGTWVLDSPISNALAHFANLALFLLGSATDASAVPALVEAELFRVNPIEMFDTCCVRTTLASGVPLTIGMTHACRDTIEPIVTLTGTGGSVRYVHAASRFEWLDDRGRLVRVLQSNGHTMGETLAGFVKLLRGEAGAPVASLENARSHTLLVNAVSEAATIIDAPAESVRIVAQTGTVTRVIDGIEPLLDRCATEGSLISELPAGPLEPKTGRYEIGDYRHFAGPRHGPRRATAALHAQVN